jgi:hypothetical protein
MSPHLRGRVKSVASLQQASAQERDRYLAAEAFNGDIARRQELLGNIARSGHKTATIDVAEAFDQVKVIRLRAGETLIEAGAPASFVYIPLADGLQIIPLGGYQPFAVRAWMPVGNTGAIRGAMRNATVVAGQDIELLMIPKEVYLRQWHHPYSVAELIQFMAGLL